MSLSDERLIERLCREDEEFKRVFQEHREYERQLQAFAGKTFLTTDEELEVSRLKKLKLKTKDRMYRLLDKHAEKR
ncbi:MAG: DUF465 domain-containing protein [Deltaproteobacteria bacterium]|nr:MAG: DUF465 domain-containing protein [Deltaproteobacteria bacterium]